jgi:hypothetical protein
VWGCTSSYANARPIIFCPVSYFSLDFYVLYFFFYIFFPLFSRFYAFPSFDFGLLFIFILQGGEMDLNATAKILDVAKRRIYDITNVLEGIGLLEKCSKNTIKWKGSGKKLEPEHEAEQHELMTRIKALRETDRALDAHIVQTYAAIEEHASVEGNKDLIYVTAEETQQSTRYCTKTMIAIQAPTQTVLEVPDPDEQNDGHRRYHVYMKSTNGPIKTHVLNSDHSTPVSVEASSPSPSSSSSSTSSSSSSSSTGSNFSTSSFFPTSTESEASSITSSTNNNDVVVEAAVAAVIASVNTSSSVVTTKPKKSSRSGPPQMSTMAAYKQVRRHGNVGVPSNYKKMKTSHELRPPAPASPAIMPLPNDGGVDFAYDLAAGEGISDFF